jgi:hypothetical protein
MDTIAFQTRLNVNVSQWKWVAEWDQLGGALRRKNAGHSCCFERITLWCSML